MTAGDPLAPLAADPAGACVVTDFDGTLAPVVPDPEAARPLPGAAATLVRLAERCGRVAVVSGRPVSFLARHLDLPRPLPGRLRVVGLYGLETLAEDGSVLTRPDAEEWRPAVARAADDADAEAPPGARVERKGLSVTLHWREAPGAREWAEGRARRSAERLGLVVHPARMSCELRPPLEVDKGSVVLDLASGFRSACYLGDDVGDLPAFDALDALAGRGVRVVKVAVASAEMAPELGAAADVTVDGPGAALALLAALADG